MKSNYWIVCFKIINKLFISLILLSIGFSNNLFSQNVAVTDDDGYTAAASAMLDVNSTTKGILIPRVDSTQRKLINSPATGLLVFDTSLNSFMYYNGFSWKAISQINAGVGAGQALFAVVNNDGDTVFAVYNDGVKVTVDEGSKGTVGGFAVSGRTPTKTGAEVQYFRVTPDSTRIYINDTAAVKGTVGGFAVSGRTPTKLGEFDYLRVTPDSTRVYVNEGFTKGTVGGFAVSGRTPTKTSLHNYFLSSTDSTRIYINDTTTTKGTVGGFAVSGRTPTKGSGDYFNVSGNTIPSTIYPSEPRIAWYPNKEAFMAGRVIVQYPDSVGLNSSALGFESRAYGDYSQAFGYSTIARGDYSTAIGRKALANNNNSFAFGDSAQAKNINSYAFGRGALAKGYGSYALGSAGVDSSGTATDFTYAEGEYSFAVGQGSHSSGKGSFSFGLGNNAVGTYSLALGYQSSASNYASAAIGYKTTSSKDGSLALGYFASSTGLYSIALGPGSASGDWSISLGYATSQGIGSLAMRGSYAIGDYSFSDGHGSQYYSFSPIYNMKTKATGMFSIAHGHGVQADAYASFVIGQQNITSTSYSKTSWVAADPLFVIGNGNGGSAMGPVTSNALTVLKNGNTGINTATPYAPLHIKGNQGILNLEGTDHFYMQFYPDGYSAGRKGYFGYASASSNDIVLVNSISEGNVGLYPGTNGSVNIGITGVALKVNGTEALWYNGTYFSWGYGASYNFFNSNVGIGNSSPSNKLDVTGTARVTGALTFNEPFNHSVTSPRYLYVTSSGEVGGVNASSIRYKENVLSLNNYDWLYNLRPVIYNYKNTTPSDIQYGLIAEEVDLVNKLLVAYKDNQPEGVMYEKLTIPMLKAIQDQQKIIQTQQSEIDLLKARLIEIENLLKK